MNPFQIKALARKYSAFRLCLEELVTLLGGQVYYTDGEFFSGVVVFEKAGSYKFLIGINGAECEQRQRYTLAHEIGHILLRHRNRKRNLFSKDNLTSLDREAELFASELLMPTHEVYSCIKEGLNFDELCDYFYVSKQAMAIKLREIGRQDLIPEVLQKVLP